MSGFPRIGLGCYTDGLYLGPYLLSIGIQDESPNIPWHG